MNDFDKELDNLLDRELKIYTLHTSAEREGAVKTIKQAVDKYVIGQDRPYSKLEECPVCHGLQYACTCDEAEERVRREQRQSLWGDKQ